jgi:hypothetical protein
MASKRGISILDLIGLPPGTDAFIPALLCEQLEKLAVLDYSATTAGDVHIYRGTVQSLADAWFPGLNGTRAEIPMLNSGVRFQLIRRRGAPAPGDNIEPSFAGWQIDLFLDRLACTMNGLQPARRVESQGTVARHLVRDTTRQGVRIVGSGTLRIHSNPDGSTGARFVSASDPLDPDTPAGALAELNFDPPHFFFGSSEFGMTVDRLVYDASPDFTPDEIAVRGHGADWLGLSIREATVYLPRNAPVVGDRSASVRDVLLGQPFGLQGELQVEFGLPKLAPAALKFHQSVMGDDDTQPNVEEVNGQGLVTYTKLDGADCGRLKAEGIDAQAQFQFTLPDGSVVRGASSGWFDARPGQSLGLQSIEVDGQGQEALSPLYRFHFHEGASPHVPTVVVSFPAAPLQMADPKALDDVLYVSGRREHLQGITFSAGPVAGNDPWDYRWRFGAGLGADTALGASIQPPIPPTLGNIDLVLTDGQQRQRRLRVEVVEEGPLVFGAASGAWMVDEQRVLHKVRCRAIEGSYDASQFNPEGLLMPSHTDVEIDLGTGELVTASSTAGALIGVTLDMGHPDIGPYADAPDAPQPEVRRHVQVVMDFGSTEELNWGTNGLAKPFSIGAVQDWAAQFGPNAEFVVIGRTCDVGHEDDNRELAALRAQRGAAVLASAVDLTRIHARGEFDAPVGNEAQQAEAAATPALSAAERAAGNLILAEHPDLYLGDLNMPPRTLYRRIDIYAVGGDESSVVDHLVDERTRTGPALRRALLPGGDIAVPVLPPVPDASTTYRLRLTVKWDSPTVVSLADAIPTLAEVRLSWDKPATLPLPPDPAIPAGAQQVALGAPQTYTLVGRWTYDSRSGATLFSLAFNNDGSPGGLLKADNKVLATALLLAPALLSGVTADSPSGAGARLAALLGAAAAATQFVDAGRVVVHGIEIQEQQRDLGRFSDATHRVLLDYTAEIDVNVASGPLTIHTTNPLKVRYDKAGLEFDGSKNGLAAINLVYDEARFDVADPGEWVIGGDLGKLLRVAGTRAGSGSTWFEVDLEFALDLGPVKVTGATVRIYFPNGSGGKTGVELRGLGVEVNVPKTLEGKGRLALGAGGEFKSDIQVKVIPAQVEAQASLILGPQLKYLEVGVLLPMGIPLGTSGLGIFGFIGRFVVNGRRQVATEGDPIDNEIAWYRKAGIDKYTPDKAEGQYALGLGAVLGTLPDSGFTFNATGMFTVAFPDPELVISLDGRLANQPTLQASEKGSAPPANSLEMLGIVVANPQEFILAIRGRYLIPGVLELKVPVSGYFPLGNNPAAYYFRVGSDGINGRSGSAVTATLLPGTLDFNCWLYLMVEERELQNLGDAAKWGGSAIHLHGYSVGFGAGFDIDWSADPFSLHAGAIFILGLGTKPLTVVGMIAAEGELDLVIVSATVSARVQGQIQQIADKTRYWLDGEFKAEVDLGLVTVGGSIHFHAEKGGQAQPPEPAHPLLRVDLVDRRGTVTGRAAALGAAQPGSTVWPDTTPVLQFGQNLANALAAGSAFQPGDPLPGDLWSGASEMKYAYRLKKLELRKKNGPTLAGKLDSVWWWPTHKGGLIAPQEPLPSEHEARALALLSWNPGLASVSIADGAKGSPGAPSKTLDDVCAPPVPAGRNLVHGSTASGQGVGQVKIVPTAPGAGTLPSWFELLGSSSDAGKDYATVVQLMAAQGRSVMPGQVRSFASALALSGETQAVAGGWELPRIECMQHFERTLQFDAQIVGAINAPALTLAVWNKGDRAPGFTTQCDSFSDLRPGPTLASGTVRNGWRYDVLALPSRPFQIVDKYPLNAPDGKLELTAVGGFSVSFSSPVSSATVDLVQWGAAVSVRAFNAGGVQVAQADSQVLNNTPQKLTLSSAGGILRLTVQLAANITGGDYVVREVCTATPRDLPAPGVPLVSGVAAGGGAKVAWPAQAAGTAPAPGGGTLQLYRYVPDPKQAWKSLRIASYDGAHLLLLGLSGVDAEMQSLSEQNEAAKQQIKDQLASNGDPSKPITAKHMLLDPGAEYEIVVECEWAAWLKSKSEPEPPSRADLDNGNLWKPFTGGAVVYGFSVAGESVPAGEDTGMPPTNFQDESRFDPRALKRYLQAIEPDGGAPHFLGDPLVARFNVDYADRLLQMYGRAMVFKLRRTDPRCGTLVKDGQNFQTPADLPMQLGWAEVPVNQLPLSDQWLAEPQKFAPCVSGHGPRGQQAVITATLEPEAEYDLLLSAPPAANPKPDQVLIARAHFRSSRYADPKAMLEALGLRSGKANPMRPHDLFVAQVFGAQVLNDEKQLQNDRNLEQMLRTLGLDPLPVPRRPRMSLVWEPQGSSFRLCGVVVDCDEPTCRGKRMQPGLLQLLRPNQAALSFGLLRSSATGTRLLYWLNTPEAPPVGATLKLEFKDRGNSVHGSRMAPSTPRVVYEESEQ